jgi:hypothetical protein
MEENPVLCTNAKTNAHSILEMFVMSWPSQHEYHSYFQVENFNQTHI